MRAEGSSGAARRFRCSRRQIAAAVKAGIRKINFGTDVCCSLLDGIRAVDPSILALDLFMQGPTARVKDFAVSKIKLLGADK